MVNFTTTTINPTDLTEAGPRPHNDWTAGDMRHLINALNGARVIVVADTQTGHTLANVQITELRTTPGYSTAQARITYPNGDRAWYSLAKMGAVTVMPDETDEAKRARWIAGDLKRKEREVALNMARTDFDHDFTTTYWSITHLMDGVYVAAENRTLVNGKMIPSPPLWTRTYSLNNLAATTN